MSMCVCDFVEKVVATAPPFTDQQRERLRAIFAPVVNAAQPVGGPVLGHWHGPMRPPCASAPADRNFCDNRSYR